MFCWRALHSLLAIAPLSVWYYSKLLHGQVYLYHLLVWYAQYQLSYSHISTSRELQVATGTRLLIAKHELTN